MSVGFSKLAPGQRLRATSPWTHFQQVLGGQCDYMGSRWKYIHQLARGKKIASFFFASGYWYKLNYRWGGLGCCSPEQLQGFFLAVPITLYLDQFIRFITWIGTRVAFPVIFFSPWHTVSLSGGSWEERNPSIYVHLISNLSVWNSYSSVFNLSVWNSYSSVFNSASLDYSPDKKMLSFVSVKAT